MATTTPNMGLVRPDLNDKKGDTIATDLPANFDKLDKASWVGMIVFSRVAYDPKLTYGENTVWDRIQGRMLIGAGNDFPAGATGGEKNHVLLDTEMPAHQHVIVTAGSDAGAYTGWSAQFGGYQTNKTGIDTTPRGGNQPHNNMPPYESVYIYVRVA